MNRRILKLAIPSILANLTVPLVSMVDVAVAGRIGNAATIGAIAVGTMLFDILYWNFGFLRIGTGGLTAQAYGRNDNKAAVGYFGQGVITALGIALLVIGIQYVFLDIALDFINPTEEIKALSAEYFKIRIWAAPASLTLFVFKGWFIGMQNTVIPMIVDTTVNVLNLVLSAYLAIYTPLSFAGIAYGTLIAQFVGLIVATVFMIYKYGHLFKGVFSLGDEMRQMFSRGDIKRFFSLNTNIFIRSNCFALIYAGFTVFSSRFGDLELAATTIIMKLLLLFSYFIDGFAYAGEALVGRYIGAREPALLKKAVKLLFVWSIGIGVVSSFGYLGLGDWLIGVMTTDAEVFNATKPYVFWLLLMPTLSCLAFIWDGIYVGATAGRQIRDCMIFAAIAFLSTYYALKGVLGIQALFVAYFAHLIVRSLYLSLLAKKTIFKPL